MIGICLGMQLLFEGSVEFGEHKGLELIEGQIIKFDKSKMHEDTKIPHMGWNTIEVKDDHTLFKGLKDPYLYFVHSYHAVTDDKNVIGTTEYGYKFVSAVNKDNYIRFSSHTPKNHMITVLKS